MPEPAVYCLDQVMGFDRARGLSLQFAPKALRAGLAALYAFNLELAKVAPLVSQPSLGDIRFQWWRDALGELQADQKPRNHPVVIALSERRETLEAASDLIDGWQTTTEQDQARDPEQLERLLMATHGRLLTACLTLIGPNPIAFDVRKAYALSWGYSAMAQALVQTGELGLAPRSLGYREPGQALGWFQDQSRGHLQTLRQHWGGLDQSVKALMAPARLISARLEDPVGYEARAAFILFLSRLKSRPVG